MSLAKGLKNRRSIIESHRLTKYLEALDTLCEHPNEFHRNYCEKREIKLKEIRR